MTDPLVAINAAIGMALDDADWHPATPDAGPGDLRLTMSQALAIRDALAVQCCMCGKTGLSTAEDGGPECELHDGRWVCSSECWEIASALCGEHAAAYRRGAEAMRARAISACQPPLTGWPTWDAVWNDGFLSGCEHLRSSIRAMPIPEDTQ